MRRYIFFNIIQYENVLFAYLYGRRENFLVKKKTQYDFIQIILDKE